MNETRIAVVKTLPDASGYCRVQFGDQSFRCFFDPKRFKEPLRVPVLNDRVLVYPSVRHTYHALYLLGTPV